MISAPAGIFRKKQRGQGLVEFALVLPVLLLLVFGVIEMGRLLFIYVAVTASSREAARYGSAIGTVPGGGPRYQDCDGMRAAAMRIGSLAGLQPVDITITYDSGPSTSTSGTCPVGGQGPFDLDLGSRVVVNVQSDYQPIAPLVNLPVFPILSESIRTIFKSIPIATATPIPVNIPVMFVYNIDIIAIDNGDGTYSAEVVVTIKDDSGSPAVLTDAATVIGEFSGASSSDVVGDTNGSGQVTFLSDPANKVKWTFCVVNLVKVNYGYDPALNIETCDSIEVFTPTPTSTASDTPTTTSTPTETPTPTDTSTPTETPTGTITPPVSPTETSTPIIVLTVTAVPIDTITPTVVPTVSSCNYLVGVLLVSTNSIFWDISNLSLDVATISSIQVSWPDIPASQKLTDIGLQGSAIWSGNSNSPPTFINSGWSGAVENRQLAALATKVMQIRFGSNLSAGTITVTVTFEDGCSVSATRP